VSLDLAYFPDEAAPAARLARALDARLCPVATHRFPDGEILPRVQAPAGEVTIIYRSLDRPNEKLIELLLATDAWRRAGAGRLILVAPYLCYLRQDVVFAAGEPLSRDAVGGMIGRLVDGLITVQAHLHRTADLTQVFGIPVRNLCPTEPFAAALPTYRAPVVLGPDEESAPWVRAMAERLGGDAGNLKKTRRGDRDVQMALGTPVDVRGRAVVIVDDIASSGQTLARAAEWARGAGAASVDVAVAHALMDEGATERLRRAGARLIVSTAAALAPLLAQAVREMIGRL